MSSRALDALAGCSFGGWREDDCWPVGSFAVPLKGAVAELRRIDTSSPGAADHEGPPLADCVDKSSPGLSGTSGTTRPFEPILEQEDSSLRWPVAPTSPASTWTAVAGGCFKPAVASGINVASVHLDCRAGRHRQGRHRQRRRPPPARLPPTRLPPLRCPMSSRTLEALAGCSFGGWREDDLKQKWTLVIASAAG